MKLPSIKSPLARVAVAGGAVIILGGSAVGIAAAQSQPAATPTAQSNAYQKFIDSLAQKLGVSSQTLQTDIQQARQDAGLPGSGGFGFPGGRGPRGGPGAGAGVNLQVAAQTLGISVQQLRTELQGKSLAQVASAHNSSGDAVATALKTAANQRIDQAVAAGRLTADQGNTQKTNIDNRIDQAVNQVTPQGGPGGPGRGPGGPAGPGGSGRGPGGPAGFGGGLIQQGLDVAAQTLGISVQQLQTELQGKSLAQVASAHNSSGDAVATALKTAANQRIDQAVAAGRLTADQGNTQKTNIDQRIDQLVNQPLPQRGQPNGQTS